MSQFQNPGWDLKLALEKTAIPCSIRSYAEAVFSRGQETWGLGSPQEFFLDWFFRRTDYFPAQWPQFVGQTRLP
jgi:hypothetical protein